MLDEYRFVQIDDAGSRLQAFMNGDADLMVPTEPQFAERSLDPDFLSENVALNWYATAGGYRYIAWNCGERRGNPSLFADARIRRAMTHLIDRERLVRDLYEGLGIVAVGPFPGRHPASAPEVEPWVYSVEEAVRLLDEAGAIDRDGDGIREDATGRPMRFEFMYSGSVPSYGELASYLRGQCRAVGIECVNVPTEWAVLLDKLEERDYDATSLFWRTDVTIDPREIWHSDSISGTGSNHAQFASAEADALIARGRATIDDNERNLVWRDLHRVIHREQPYTFLVEVPRLAFHRRSLGNVVGYANRIWRREFARVRSEG